MRLTQRWWSRSKIPQISLTREKFVDGQLIHFCVVHEGVYYWAFTAVAMRTPSWKALEEIHRTGEHRMLFATECITSCCVSTLQLEPCQPGIATIFFEARTDDLIREREAFGSFVDQVRERFA